MIDRQYSHTFHHQLTTCHESEYVVVLLHDCRDESRRGPLIPAFSADKENGAEPTLHPKSSLPSSYLMQVKFVFFISRYHFVEHPVPEHSQEPCRPWMRLCGVAGGVGPKKRSLERRFPWGSAVARPAVMQVVGGLSTSRFLSHGPAMNQSAPDACGMRMWVGGWRVVSRLLVVQRQERSPSRR